MAKYSSQDIIPKILTREIQDVYIRQNFSNLFDYFSNQNQLLDFKFFDLSLEGAQENIKVDHGLGVIPQDIIVTKISGEGSVKFNRGKFTTSQLDITTTGSAKIRFFVGSYWKEKFSTNSQDAEEISEFKSTEAASSGAPAGSIIAYGGTKAPDGWLLCNGTSYKQTDYKNLYAAIGSAYGGSSTNFNVPTLTNAIVVENKDESVIFASYSNRVGSTLLFSSMVDNASGVLISPILNDSGVSKIVCLRKCRITAVIAGSPLSVGNFLGFVHNNSSGTAIRNTWSNYIGTSGQEHNAAYVSTMNPGEFLVGQYDGGLSANPLSTFMSVIAEDISTQPVKYIIKT